MSSAATPPAPLETGEERHALETVWTLYCDHKVKGVSASFDAFKAQLKRLGSFNTVESAWRHLAYLKRPSQLPLDWNVYLFRHGGVPAWESFPAGGCWLIKVRKANGQVDRLWEELCFAAIGEMFAEPAVVGVCVSTRLRYDVISVWDRDARVRFRIGERLKELLNLDESSRVEYKEFRSSIRDGSTYRGGTPYVYSGSGRGSKPATPVHAPSQAPLLPSPPLMPPAAVP